MILDMQFLHSAKTDKKKAPNEQQTRDKENGNIYTVAVSDLIPK